MRRGDRAILSRPDIAGEDGALANRFIRYLELEARGEGGPDALYRQIGMTADELETATARHVKGLKTH